MCSVGYDFVKISENDVPDDLKWESLLRMGSKSRSTAKKNRGGFTPEVIEKYIQDWSLNDRLGSGLGEAARWGYLDLVKEILKANIHVDTPNEFGDTSLMLAASGGQLEVVKYLISAGADVNAISSWNGMTPLMACVSAGHPKRVYLSVVQELLDAGAAKTLHVKDNTGRTALDWAKWGRPPELVALLEKYLPGA